MSIPAPSKDQALQFVIMLRAGLPAEQAILYFLETDDPLVVSQTLQRWQRSREVSAAQRQLQGKDWQEMSDEEMMQAALGQHYRNLAFLLHSTNYITANQGEKAKLDSARTALEAKLAGTAGKMNALEQFYEDLRKGSVRLNPTVRLMQ